MGRGKMKRDSKKDELRLSFWDDTLITDMDCIYGWIAFSGDWGKCHFSIIQTFILLYMPEIWKPFLLFFVFVLPYRCAVDCRWILLLLQVKFNGRQRLLFPLLLLPLSSERQILSAAKPLSFSCFCLLANLHSSAHHHGLFPGIRLSSGSPDICCPSWAWPGRIWHNTGFHGPWSWTTSQCLWRCALISTPGD